MKFAKLIDLGEEQVLARLCETDDEKPALSIETDVEGLNVKTTYGFDTWEKVEKALEIFDEEKAKQFRKGAEALMSNDE